jgi:hypothetical protein
MDASVVMSVVFGVVAALAWLFRLEGRINGHELRFSAQEKAIEEIREDLRYVRDRIDRAINGRFRSASEDDGR